MIVDFRSDTVTQPTDEMKEAMFSAKVGDDVFGDDPTVNELESYVSNLFGVDAAVFCPSGTMTNQIAIKLHTNPPGELICDETSHVYKYEGGGIGFNSGLATKLVAGKNGQINVELIKSAINPDDIHFPETQLVSLENTCNKGGGTIYSVENIKSIGEFCNEKSLKYHLDGARVFNAIVESNYSTKDLGEAFDTISICLSKGLGAPVGSLLLGNKADINKARRLRKIFGGGMRQAGILAAGGLYALKNNIERLKDDHVRAKALGAELLGVDWIKQVWPVYSNIIVFEVQDSVDLQKLILKLDSEGLRVSAFGPQQIRLVTHLDINDDMINYSIEKIKSLSI